MARIHLCLLILSVLAGCAGQGQHGDISELTASAGEGARLCEHAVPGEVCTRCHPELEGQFKAVKDWCGPHGVPESQCHICHPDLDFDPLPEVPAGADLRELTEAEALGELEAQVSAGRVTVFDFHAPWCAPCRKVDAWLRGELQADPALAVRKVHLADWEGPVAAKHLREVPGLPYVIVYDAQGRRVGALHGLDLEALGALVARAREAQP
jgi:thiol-disulfide isomerase/thioredoxin